MESYHHSIANSLYFENKQLYLHGRLNCQNPVIETERDNSVLSKGNVSLTFVRLIKREPTTSIETMNIITSQCD